MNGDPPRGERVLVVEDDVTVAAVVAGYLHRAGFVVAISGNGREALSLALERPPSLVLLDLTLPGLDGLNVLRALRAVHTTPVIMLTSRRDTESRVQGLLAGADDYVVKPFSPRELVARVQAVLRRAAPTEELPETLEVGGLRVDVRERRAHRDDLTVPLTTLELALLTFMMRRPGRSVSRQELLESVWGFSHGQPSAVTVEIRRLRTKLERDPSRPRWITTVRGSGYRFEP